MHQSDDPSNGWRLPGVDVGLGGNRIANGCPFPLSGCFQTCLVSQFGFFLQWQGLLDSTIENLDLHRKSFFSIYRFSLPPEIPEEKWKSSLLFSLQWLQIKTETWSWTFYTALWEIVRSWTLLGNLIFDSCKFAIMSCLSKHSKHPELWPQIKEKSPTITWLMNLKSRVYKVINCFLAPWLMTRGLISAQMSDSIRSWSCQPVLI